MPAKPAPSVRAGRPRRIFDLLLPFERLEQRPREPVVEPRVEEDALARAGDVRQHACGVALVEAASASAAATIASGRK